MKASQAQITAASEALPSLGVSSGPPPRSWWTPTNTAARAKLVTGPAIAMRSCAPGVAGSDSSRAKPPSSHNVMPSTSMPSCRATSEWPISCASREAKKSSEAMTPAAQ